MSEPETDEGAETDPEILAVAIHEDRRDRKWFELLRGFVNDRDPTHCGKAGDDVTTRDYPDSVREAEGRAVRTCYKAIEAMAARFAPPPTFTLDVSKIGRG